MPRDTKADGFSPSSVHKANILYISPNLFYGGNSTHQLV